MITEWIKPIFDRSPADVTRAQLQVQEWIKALSAGKSVTITDLKGYFNVADINRIENNTKYLSLYSHLSFTIKTNWSRTELPNIIDIQRIIENINALIVDFELSKFIYEMPTTILTYKHANTIEHNLSLIKYLLEDMSTRIQSEFSQVDAKVQTKTVVVLTLPFGTTYEKFVFSASAKAVNAGVIPVDSILDILTVIFTAKAVDSDSIPSKLETEIELGLLGETNNSPSNSIKAILCEENNLDGKVNNSDSTPMKQAFSVVKSDLDTLFLVLSPDKIKLLDGISTNFISESIAYTEATNSVIMADKVNFGFSTANINFADMFIKSIFSMLVAELNSKVILTESQSVIGLISTTITTESIVGLYAYSKLSDYATIPLVAVDSISLKDLSFREIL